MRFVRRGIAAGIARIFSGKSLELSAPPARRNRLVLEPLENRILLSADPLAAGSLLVVDGSVANHAQFSGREVLVLDQNRDGLEQISEALASRSGVNELHIVSHGASGSLTLGSTSLDISGLEAHEAQLRAWADALTADADILFYGCNLAADEAGMAFVRELSRLTGADVAGSTDLTGSESLGGDWVLEYSTGAIEAEALAAQGDLVLATINYDAATDTLTFTADDNEADNVTILSSTVGQLRIIVAGDTLSLAGAAAANPNFVLTASDTQLFIDTAGAPLSSFTVSLDDADDVQNDTVSFTNNLDTGLGSVSIDGGGGTDAITLNNTTLAGNLSLSTETVTVVAGNRVNVGTNAISASGSVTFAGASTVTAATFTAGSLVISTGTVNLNADTDAGSLNLSGGTLQGSGNLTLTGTSSTWNDGTYTGTGQLVVSSGHTLTIGTATQKAFGSATLVNDGTVLWTGGNIDVVGSGMVQNRGLFDIQSGGTLGDQGAGVGTLTFNNELGATLRKSGGTLTALGSLGVPGGTANGVSLTNAGTVDVQTGILSINHGFNGSQVPVTTTSTGSGTFSVAGGATLQFGAANTLTPSSTVSGTGAVSVMNGTFSTAGTWSNTGALTVNGGTATFSPTGAFAPGSVTIAGGAATFNTAVTTGPLAVSGGAATFNSPVSASALTVSTGTLMAGANVSVSGDSTLSSGTLNANGSINATTYNQSGGTLAGTGALTATGLMTWTGGTMTGTGTTNADGGLTLSGTANKDLTGGRTLNNTGAATWSNPSAIAGQIRTGGGATINNSGTWDDQNAFNNLISNAFGGAASTFDNTGTYTKSGPGSTFISIGFNNSGTVEVQTGLLDISGPLVQTGDIDVAGGATFRKLGGFTSTSTATLSGNGTIEVGSGNTLTNAGTIDPGAAASAGLLTIEGNLTLTGTSVFNFHIGGLARGTEFDAIDVNPSVPSGSAIVTVDGTLNVDLVNDFAPVDADRFRFMTFGARTGFFATTSLPTKFYIDQTDATDLELVFDTTPPTVSIDQAAGREDPTNDSPITFTVLFSEVVTGFSASDISFAGSTVGGTLAASVTGSGASYTVEVTGMTGDGVVVASIGAAAANDQAGNASFASISTDNSVRFDNVAPTVTIDQAAGQADPTNAAPISFTVVFSEVVSGFGADDVSFAGSTVDGTPAATVTGGGASYLVTVSGMDGVGNVVASIVSGAASDAAGNASAASTSTDNTVSFDNVAPMVTINQAGGQADPINASPILFTVVFSEVIVGFTAEDISFAGSTVGGTLTASVSGTGATYTVSVTGMDGTGTVVASTIAGAARDAEGNFSLASTSTDNTVTFDNVAPTVTIDQSATQGDPTNASPILFTVLFSEVITGFTAEDISFAGSTVGGLLTASVSGSGANYTVAVSGMNGVGTVVASIAGAAANDAAGNASAASTSTDNTVTFDNVAPTVTINQAAGQTDPTNASPILFTVVFSDVITGFTAEDISFAGSTVGGLLTASVSGSDATYTVSITGMDGTGTVVASVVIGAATDAAGNASVASTSTDNTVTFDNVAPTVTINQAAGQADPTNASPILFTVVFNEAISGFTADDVSFAGSTVGGTLTASVSGSGASYTVAVSGMNGVGTVVASVAGGAANDAAGNASAASTSTDNTVFFDNVAPAVTIDQAAGQADPTDTAPILFTVVFSEAIVGFTAEDISFAGSTAAGTLIAIVSGSGATYTVAVNGMTDAGTVVASVAERAATDAAGNFSAASTSTDNVVFFEDNHAPVAGDDEAETDEDHAVTIAVLANDQDADGDTLTVVSASDAENGEVAVNLDGTVTYTPDANFHGEGGFSYVVSDGEATAVGFVVVTVKSINDNPVGVPDSTTTDEGVAVTVDVVANDDDVDGDALTVAAVTQGANGTVVFSGATVTYTPNAGFTGPDSFSYTVSDGHGGTATAAVAVTVSPSDENAAPVLNDVPEALRKVTEGKEMRFTISATDADDAAGTLVYSAADLPVGAIFDPVTREFFWIPADDATATVTFTVLDPHDAFDEMEVVLTATNVAAEVDAGADQLVGLQKDKDDGDDDDGHPGLGRKVATVELQAAFNDLGTADTHTALINWGDGTVESGTVSEAPFGPPGSTAGANGTVAGSHTYTKAGVYTVTVTVTDDNGGVFSDTLVITVEKPGKKLKGKADKYEVMENGVLTVDAGHGVLANDRGRGTLVARLVEGPEHGSLTLNANGSFTYVPDAGFDGKDVFWYEFNNGSSVSKLVKVELKVKDDGRFACDWGGRWNGLFGGGKHPNFAEFLLKLKRG